MMPGRDEPPVYNRVGVPTMAAYAKTRQFTVDEYYRMADAGILTEDDRVELIDGEIIEMPPIGSPHASCVLRLNRFFDRSVGESALVSVQNPLHLDDRSEPEPDVMLLRPRADFYRSGHPTAADVLLLIEVSDSTIAFDRGVKIPLYARHRIPEVWLVDIGEDAIHVYRDPSPTGYRTVATHGRGERLTPSSFSDLSFAVDEILG
jgi:Uma2 family endonuclease